MRLKEIATHLTKVKDTHLNKVKNRGLVSILAYIIYSHIIINFGAKIMLSNAIVRLKEIATHLTKVEDTHLNKVKNCSCIT